MSGQQNQNYSSVCIGYQAGRFIQNSNSVAIGYQAGYSYQSSQSVAIGDTAGTGVQGSQAVAIGALCGTTSQGTQAVAIGYTAGNATQGSQAISIGQQAGQFSQNAYSIAIGTNAGQSYQSGGSIAIGLNAGQSGQHSNTIVISAKGSVLNTGQASSCYIYPVRNLAQAPAQTLLYNNTTGEVTYGTPSSDLRLKSNIESANLNTCYNIIKSLDLKRFRYPESVYTDEQCPDRTKLGWLAQDVETFLPKSIWTTTLECANNTVINDCLMLDTSQLYAAMFGTIKMLVEKNEQPPNEFSGKGTVENDGSNCTTITVHSASTFAEPIIQATPIFNGARRILNVGPWDSNSNSFIVYCTPGDFYWTVKNNAAL